MDRTHPVPARARTERVRQAYLRRAPQVIGWCATVLGFLLVVDALVPDSWRIARLVSSVVPDPAGASADAILAVGGWLLLRLARGLRRRKRAEWRFAVAVSAVVAVASAIGIARHPVETVATVALLVALILARSHYTALADPRGRWFALRVALQFVVVSFGYGLVLLYLPGHVPAGTTLADRLREIAASLVGLGGDLRISGSHYADLVHATLLGLGLVTVTCALAFAVRPVEPPARLDPEDEQRLRSLLATHGSRDSLGYFALRRDKSVVWSASGKAAVTYRVVSGVALVSGDPLGDPEAWPGAIEAYRDLVDRHGWTPAVMGCSALGATVFRREYGLAALEFGDEAVVEVDRFSLEGRAMRGVRQACARAERAGYTVQLRRVRDLSRAEIDEIRVAADAWRVDPVERGFSMALSRFGDPQDSDCVLVTAHRNGALHGLLHFVPWSSDGLSLDLMRRDRAADNGLNELMIVSTLHRCASLGVRRVSLNFAVFRDALARGERIGAGPVLRLWRRVLLIASRWWQIDSLYRFNDKFAPSWQPRYFCYPRARDIPRVALAALEAEAFVVRPRVVSRLLGRPAPVAP